jgi:hypothetical protein
MKSLQKIFIIVCSTVLLLGCEKEREIELIRHDTQEIDLNGDLINDIKIYYSGYTWDGFGPDGTGMGVEGYIMPINNTELLQNNDIGHFFDRGLDTIRYTINTPYLWDAQPFLAVDVRTSVNQKPWTIFAAFVKDYYYLGFKKINTTEKFIGWIKLTIDKYNGQIVLKDVRTSSQDFLIIGL